MFTLIMTYLLYTIIIELAPLLGFVFIVALILEYKYIIAMIIIGFISFCILINIIKSWVSKKSSVDEKEE